MIDTHDELARAWKALQFARRAEASAGTRQRCWPNLPRRPAPKRSCYTSPTRDWNDPVKRTALVNRWQNEALDRYKSVLAQIPRN